MEYTFWDSNLFQSIVMIVSVLVTIVVALFQFHSHKKKELKKAATILLLQIDDIERNIEYILSEGIINGVLQASPMHYSTIIYDDNQWTKYSHLIVGAVSQDVFEKIDNFFKVACRIREQQIYIKQKIQQTIDSKVWDYYNAVYAQIANQKDPAQSIKELYTRFDTTSAPSFIQLEFAIGLEKTLKQYHRLSDGIAYERLKKMK